jgi:plastocyanin
MRSLILISIFFSFSFVSLAKEVKPLREVAIIVTKEGYYPKSISVFEGEKVKFYVTSTVEDPNCLIVESHKVFMAANKGKITEGETTFDKAGEYAFYCPSSKNDGKVVVLRRNSPKREVASEKNEASVWMPKEY